MKKNLITEHFSQFSLSNNISSLLRSALPICLAFGPLAACGQPMEEDVDQTQSELSPSGPIRISYGSDPLQFGDLRLPGGRNRGNRQVAVIVHGGCWTNLIGYDIMNDMSDALTAAGVATWNIEFRRTADPGGGFPGTMADVGRAIDKLRDLSRPYSLDLDTVVAVGHSSGGQLVSWAATRPKLPQNDPARGSNPLHLAATVPLAGIFDLTSYYNSNLCGTYVGPFMGGSPTDVPQNYNNASPIKHLPTRVPQSLVHGDIDDIVPIAQSVNFKNAAVQVHDRVTLKTIAGGDHFDMITVTSPRWPQVMQGIMDGIAVGKNGNCDDDDQGQNGQ